MNFDHENQHRIGLNLMLAMIAPNDTTGGYTCTLKFGDSTSQVTSWISLEDARYHCHHMAYMCGDLKISKLRKIWWQFWRPLAHTDIEKRILAEGDKK